MSKLHPSFRRSLHRIAWLRNILFLLRRTFLVRIMGMDIHPTAKFSLSSKFDLTYPKGVHIGPETYVTFGVRVLTHDISRGLYVHTRVGGRCLIGGNSIILPGVTIGDGCIVGAGSVVTKDVPPKSMVAGNPARVVRSGLDVGPYGRLPDADAMTRYLDDQGLI